jgi:hypothetical protein
MPDVAADMLTLGEDVRDELVRIDGDVAIVQTDIGRGWRPIAAASFSGAPPFTVDLTQAGTFPAGTFHAVRIRARGSLTGSPGYITVRVNNDSTTDLHESVRISQVVSDGSVDSSAQGPGSVWRIGRWGTLTGRSNLECIIHHTGGSNILSCQSKSASMGSTAAASFISEFAGVLAASRLLSSLRFSTFDASSDISAFDYQIEGWAP